MTDKLISHLKNMNQVAGKFAFLKTEEELRIWYGIAVSVTTIWWHIVIFLQGLEKWNGVWFCKKLFAGIFDFLVKCLWSCQHVFIQFVSILSWSNGPYYGVDLDVICQHNSCSWYLCTNHV